jgi:hypothetical protein
MRRAFAMAGMLVALSTACGDSGRPPDDRDQGGETSQVREGTWGGENARLHVTSTGATLESGCFSGVITGAVTTGPDGSFSLSGTVQTFGLPEPDKQAMFRGTIQGNVMTLSVTWTNEDGSPGAYAGTLLFGEDGPLTGPMC